MKRKSNSYLRAPAADFLRFASIAIVAWYHLWQQSWLNPNFNVLGKTIDIYPMIRTGYMFVYNMILISGFVLTLSYLEGRYKSALDFYKSRLIRILPSYLFCISVFLILSNLKGGTYDYSGGAEHMWQDIISHVTFTFNLFYRTYISTGLNVALWTLAVEVQFYALFPLLIRAFTKKPLYAYIAMVLVSLLWKICVHAYTDDSTMYINRLPAMLDVFANGMMSALIYNVLKQKRQFKLVNLVMSLAALYGMYLICREVSYVDGAENQRIAQMWGASKFSLCGSVFLLCGSLSFRWLSAVWSNPVSRFLCGISYNFYMWHQPISVWLKKLRIPYYSEEFPNMSGNSAWQHKYMLISALAALLVAFALTYLIEKPCARLLSKSRKAKTDISKNRD